MEKLVFRIQYVILIQVHKFKKCTIAINSTINNKYYDYMMVIRKARKYKTW